MLCVPEVFSSVTDGHVLKAAPSPCVTPGPGQASLPDGISAASSGVGLTGLSGRRVRPRENGNWGQRLRP